MLAKRRQRIVWTHTHWHTRPMKYPRTSHPFPFHVDLYIWCELYADLCHDYFAESFLLRAFVPTRGEKLPGRQPLFLFSSRIWILFDGNNECTTERAYKNYFGCVRAVWVSQTATRLDASHMGIGYFVFHSLKDMEIGPSSLVYLVTHIHIHADIRAVCMRSAHAFTWYVVTCTVPVFVTTFFVFFFFLQTLVFAVFTRCSVPAAWRAFECRALTRTCTRCQEMKWRKFKNEANSWRRT